jgi:hypothetical protein
MATPDKTTVARWASSLTLGLPTPIADAFDTTKYFAKGPLRIHYAAVFNGATATQIHDVSPFSWICCIQPEDLAPITTGAALVAKVESHLTDQLKAAGTAETPTDLMGAPAETTTELPLADGGTE